MSPSLRELGARIKRLTYTDMRLFALQVSHGLPASLPLDEVIGSLLAAASEIEGDSPTDLLDDDYQAPAKPWRGRERK